MERAAIFIDGAYLDKTLQFEFSQVRIDFGLLSERMAGRASVLRTYYYHCPPYMSMEPTPDERVRADAKDRFFSALARLPRFQLRLGKLVRRGEDRDGRPIFVQKLVDIMLGVDLVQLAATRQISQAVLLVGDSDFLPAIEVAKQLGVMVVLWHGPMSANGSVHRDLWESCDERHEITQGVIDDLRRSH